MKPYEQAYPVESSVQIADRGSLEAFQRAWRWHHPLVPEQLAFAGRVARVESVAFYHGGDVLYLLKNVPGTWHEDCLRRAG